MKSLGNIILILFLIFPVTVFSQSPNYSEDIAPILYAKCTECHNPNGIAPVFINELSRSFYISPQIVLSVISGNMPPWPPDTNYQRYAHEKILSADEINKIINWNNFRCSSRRFKLISNTSKLSKWFKNSNISRLHYEFTDLLE